jgi:hypothetical protein
MHTLKNPELVAYQTSLKSLPKKKEDRKQVQQIRFSKEFITLHVGPALLAYTALD